MKIINIHIEMVLFKVVHIQKVKIYKPYSRYKFNIFKFKLISLRTIELKINKNVFS